MNAECKATEPAPRAGSCRTRSAAYRPPAFLLIERRVAAPVISVHCHSWLQRERHEKHRRSPPAGLAKEPARVQYAGCGYGRKPGSIQHGRFCPHPAGLRSRPVRQELEATTSVRDTVGRFFFVWRDETCRSTQLSEQTNAPGRETSPPQVFTSATSHTPLLGTVAQSCRRIRSRRCADVAGRSRQGRHKAPDSSL